MKILIKETVMPSTDCVGEKCGQKSQIYPYMLTHICRPPRSLPLRLRNFRFSYLKSPPPPFQNWTSHAESEFFLDLIRFQIWLYQITPPPPIPTLTLKKFLTSDLVTSNHPLPPNLEHFLNF